MITLLSTALAWADYRVFVLKLEDENTKTTRQFLSTLAPEQYQTIYPLNPQQKLTYVDTWRCWGRSDNYTPLCAKPEPKSNTLSPETRAPAGEKR